MFMKDYEKLINLKKIIIYPLLFIIICSYFSFILLIAYYPNWLSQKIFDSSISYGIAYGFFLIFLIFLVTLVYVYLSNKLIEPIVKRI
ncbi:MAG: DUF485 domain-containing protein [Methylophilaceae bacterium]|jgi:uncharacterized membrane protein (DUF485 family)